MFCLVRAAYALVMALAVQAVLQNLRNKPKAWNLGTASALISHEREFKALHEVKNMKVSTLCRTASYCVSGAERSTCTA